jgi:hypothetical protein
MVEEGACCFVESAGGIDENIPSITPIQMWSSSLLDIQNVHV